MVVPAPLGVGRVVLAGKERLVHPAHELDVVQHRPPVRAVDLVVPVDHQALPAHVDALVVQVFLHVDGRAAHLPLVLGILPVQQILVHQLHHEEVPAVLQVRHPRLPEELEQVDAADADVPQAVFLALVPEHAVGRRAVLELLPPAVGVDLFVLVLLQDHRQHRAQNAGALLVALLPGQHHRGRVVVHGVRMLVDEGVKQPRARGPCLARSAFVPADHLPVPQLPPQLVLHHPVFQVGLPALVLGQRRLGLGQFFLPDGRPVRPPLECPARLLCRPCRGRRSVPLVHVPLLLSFC